jgi:protein arginine N-methyltransferase 1
LKTIKNNNNKIKIMAVVILSARRRRRRRHHHPTSSRMVVTFLTMLIVLVLALLASSAMLLIAPGGVFAEEETEAKAATATSTCDDDNKDGSSSCENPDIVDPADDDDESIPSFKYDKDSNNSDNNNSSKAQQEVTKSKDMAEYFSAYAELHHQKDMLEDVHRMDSYYQAIMNNSENVFKNKIVLDVGTGSGILALWAAKAGARKVYAIEYTDMAYNARQLIKDNGYEHIITVIQGTVESITLPLKEDGLLLMNNSKEGEDSEDNEQDVDEHVIDVIVSEWMGYMLLRESMLDSVLIARDKYLKPTTGLMFPSHATIYLAPLRDEITRLDNIHNYKDSIDDWYEFLDRTQTNYGIDYDTLTEKYNKEQLDYYLYQSHWKEFKQQQNNGGTNDNDDILVLPQEDSQIIKELDLITCTLKDTRGILGVTSDSEKVNGGNYDNNVFDFVINSTIVQINKPISGFLSWFTTDFKSRTDNKITKNTPKLKQPYITLNTGPNQIPSTHWGQQAFYFRNPIRIKSDLKKSVTLLSNGDSGNGSGNDDSGKGDVDEEVTVHLKGKLELFRTKNNKRLYNVRIQHHIEEISSTSITPNKILRQTNSIEAIYKIP